MPASEPWDVMDLWAPASGCPVHALQARLSDSSDLSSPVGEELTTKRPKLSQPEPQMAPLGGANDMKDERAKPAGARAPLPTGRPCARTTRREFHLLDRTLSSLARRGSKQCRKAMHRLDGEFGLAVAEEIVEPDDINDHARTLLRAICALCPRRCKDPLA